MYTASKELCGKLYRLSEWGGETTEYHWYKNEEPGGTYTLVHVTEAPFYQSDTYWPAYDLGYLLRRLPKATQLTKRSPSNFQPGDKDYLIRINFGSRTDLKRDFINKFYIQDDSPENAACKLAIELFKQGLLTKGE